MHVYVYDVCSVTLCVTVCVCNLFLAICVCDFVCCTCSMSLGSHIGLYDCTFLSFNYHYLPK